MKSFHWYTFCFTVFLSSFDAVYFETPVGTFRLVHFFVAFCLLISGAAFIKGSKRALRNLGGYTIGVILFIYLLYGPFTLVYSFYPKGTQTMILGQICNIIIFFYCYGILAIYPSLYARLPNMIITGIKIQSVFIVINFVLAVAGFISSVNANGDSNTGLLGVARPGGFFNDPNWVSEFIVVLFFCALYFYKDGRISHKQMMSLSIIVIGDFVLTESRVALLFLLVTLYFFFFKRDNRNVITFTFIIPVFLLALALGGDIKSLLPSRFYYDILDYQNNPRLADINNLLTELTFHHRYQFGFGWGALPYIADTYYWRNYSGSINVLPIQILFDFGYVGLTIFTIIFFVTLKRYKNPILRFAFFTLMFFNVFHMSAYKQFYWVLLALILFLNRNGKSPIYNPRVILGAQPEPEEFEEFPEVVAIDAH